MLPKGMKEVGSQPSCPDMIYRSSSLGFGVPALWEILLLVELGEGEQGCSILDLKEKKKEREGCMCSLAVLKRPICQKEEKRYVFLFKRTLMQTAAKKKKEKYGCASYQQGVFVQECILHLDTLISWVVLTRVDWRVSFLFLFSCKLLMEQHFISVEYGSVLYCSGSYPAKKISLCFEN